MFPKWDLYFIKMKNLQSSTQYDYCSNLMAIQNNNDNDDYIYNNWDMISEQSTIFPKQIKIDDYEPASEDNVIRIMQTSNLLLGNGGRSSSTSVILAKCLHLLQQENSIALKGKNVLELGCGVGLLGIYLCCIGANVVLSDLPQMKDMVQRNINLNRDLIKGEAEFLVLNWKKQTKKQEMAQKQEGVSTSSSDISNFKFADKIDWLIACQSGSLEQFELQLKWIGKSGMIVAFLQRQTFLSDQFLNPRQLEQFLLENNYQYQRIQSFHPDYVDQRVCIYKIWK